MVKDDEYYQELLDFRREMHPEVTGDDDALLLEYEQIKRLEGAIRDEPPLEGPLEADGLRDFPYDDCPPTG